MHEIAVGKPYNPNRLQWPEGASYQCRGGQHELVLFFSGITQAERQAVKKGRPEFALLVRQPVIWLMYRFGTGIPWSDSPFTIHLVANPAERRVPEAAEGKRALLTTIVVDAGTGIVRAIRACSLSPELTALLHAAIEEQAAAPFDRSAYDAAVNDAFRRYSTTEAMVKDAVIVETGGKA
jgi:hypothetical protein